MPLIISILLSSVLIAIIWWLPLYILGILFQDPGSGGFINIIPDSEVFFKLSKYFAILGFCHGLLTSLLISFFTPSSIWKNILFGIISFEVILLIMFFFGFSYLIEIQKEQSESFIPTTEGLVIWFLTISVYLLIPSAIIGVGVGKLIDVVSKKHEDL